MSLTMRMATCAAVFAFAASLAHAADVKTPLACKLGTGGATQQLTITNSTPSALKKETIVNFAIKTKQGDVPGSVDTCFALAAPLASHASIAHAQALDAGAQALSCSAFLSSALPAIQHNPDGSTEQDCDTQ